MNLKLLKTVRAVIGILESLLLKDKKGAKVQRIVEIAGRDSVHIIKEIYRRWMNSDPEYSWTKLAQCFRDCDLNVLASAIEEHFELPPSQNTQEGRHHLTE